MAARYVRPTGADAVLNGAVGLLSRLGISLAGSRELAVRGRTSGEWRTTPVNPLTVGGVHYLVSPRGHTQWVRNLRVGGTGELRKGRRIEAFEATEVADAEKPPILRAYLKAWAWEVGRFFEHVVAPSPEERLLEIAPGFSVFRLTTVRA